MKAVKAAGAASWPSQTCDCKVKVTDVKEVDAALRAWIKMAYRGRV